MAVSIKNFVKLREIWVCSKVAGMKTTFLTIFDPTSTNILAPKGPNKELLKQHFSQERQTLYYWLSILQL